MKAVLHWVKAILIDAVFFALLAFGESGGISWALNVFVFWVWTLTVMGILIGAFGDKSWFPAYEAPGIRTYHYLTQLALISALAGLGMTVLAICQFVAMVGMLSARAREPKEEATA